MTPKNDFVPVALEALPFAPADYPWDEAAALKRLKDALGPGSLASYSLWIDTSMDPESEEAYPMLVVDLVAGEPLVIPRALLSAGQKAESLTGEEKSFVLERLAALEERKKDQAGGLRQPADEPANGRTAKVPPEEIGVDESARDDVAANTAATQRAQALISRLKSEGKILAAWGGETLLAFTAGLSHERSLHDEYSQELSPFEFFAKLLESLPPLVPLDELASPRARKDDTMESLGRRIASALNRSCGGGA